MVTMNDTELTVKEQCELLSINRSTLYYKPKEPQETAIEREEYIKSRIDYWHTKFCVFGHRRIREKLRREDGIQIGRKLVRRYMAEMNLCTVYPKPNLSKPAKNAVKMPYLLKNLKIERPNQVWAIDITYISMKKSQNTARQGVCCQGEQEGSPGTRGVSFRKRRAGNRGNRRGIQGRSVQEEGRKGPCQAAARCRKEGREEAQKAALPVLPRRQGRDETRHVAHAHRRHPLERRCRGRFGVLRRLCRRARQRHRYSRPRGAFRIGWVGHGEEMVCAPYVLGLREQGEAKPASAR